MSRSKVYIRQSTIIALVKTFSSRNAQQRETSARARRGSLLRKTSLTGPWMDTIRHAGRGGHGHWTASRLHIVNLQSVSELCNFFDHESNWRTSADNLLAPSVCYAYILLLVSGRHYFV